MILKLGTVFFAVSLFIAGCGTAPTPEVAAVPPTTAAASGSLHPLVVVWSASNAQSFVRGGLFGAPRLKLTQAAYSKRNSLTKGPQNLDPIPQKHAEPSYVAGFFAGKTITTFGASHGQQVSYLAPDGAVYLWYPGNAVILKGDWRVLSAEDTADIDDPLEGEYRGNINAASLCFKYGANTFNPVTRHTGSRYECGYYQLMFNTTKEARTGDVFGLATNAAPKFSLGKEYQPIAALQRRLAASR
jgi:hypothetical protein